MTHLRNRKFPKQSLNIYALEFDDFDKMRNKLNEKEAQIQKFYNDNMSAQIEGLNETIENLEKV